MIALYTICAVAAASADGVAGRLLSVLPAPGDLIEGRRRTIARIERICLNPNHVWVNHRFDNPGRKTCECYPRDDPCLRGGECVLDTECEFPDFSDNVIYLGREGRDFEEITSIAPILCSADVQTCPDGVTTVSRDGTNGCEFQECPFGSNCENIFCDACPPDMMFAPELGCCGCKPRPVVEFKPFDGGCRTFSGGFGRFDNVQFVDSASDCQKECTERHFSVDFNECFAAEYNPSNRVCEIHLDMISHGSGFSSEGTKCWIPLGYQAHEGGCRTASGGRGNHINIMNVPSSIDCQFRCDDIPNCVAAEYNPRIRVCEIHRETIVRASGPNRDGTKCYIPLAQ